MRCEHCWKGTFLPRFERVNAGATVEGYPSLDFEYFKCIHCGKLTAGRLK